MKHIVRKLREQCWGNREINKAAREVREIYRGQGEVRERCEEVGELKSR